MNTWKLFNDTRRISRELNKLKNQYLVRSDAALVPRIKELQLQLDDLTFELENYIELCHEPFTRDIIRLYYICGLTEAEIAQIENCSRPNVSIKIKEFWELIKWKV